MQLSMPSPALSSGRMQRKILSLGSSFGLNKESSDSGADTTPRAAKLSPATLSRHRAESSGYDSIVRDSETSSITSDSSRQTGALQEHQGNHQVSFEYSFLKKHTTYNIKIIRFANDTIKKIIYKLEIKIYRK